MQVVGPFGGTVDGNYDGLLDGLSNTFLIGERTGGNEICSGERVDPVATAALIGLDGGGWADLLNGEHWIQGSLHGGLSWPPVAVLVRSIAPTPAVTVFTAFITGATIFCSPTVR